MPLVVGKFASTSILIVVLVLIVLIVVGFIVGLLIVRGLAVVQDDHSNDNDD